MTQALYAHINNKRKKKEMTLCVGCLRFSLTILVYMSLNPPFSVILSHMPLQCGTSLLVTNLIYKYMTDGAEG
jgi:hypothetical protein